MKCFQEKYKKLIKRFAIALQYVIYIHELFELTLFFLVELLKEVCQ